MSNHIARTWNRIQDPNPVYQIIRYAVAGWRCLGENGCDHDELYFSQLLPPVLLLLVVSSGMS